MTSQPRNRDTMKRALIAVLAVLLLFVLANRTTKVDDEAAAVPAAAPAPEVADALGTVTVSKAQLPDLPELPSLPLEEVLLHDPFAYPAELAPPATAAAANGAGATATDAASLADLDRQELLESLQSTPISAYYRSQRGVVALVGTRLLRVGDVVDGQVRVEQIEPEGVIYGIVAP